MKNALSAIVASLLAFSAHAATNLPIVTKDTTVAGKAVNSVSPEFFYGTPSDNQYCRVAPSNVSNWTDPDYKWKRCGDVGLTEKVEGCANELADPTTAQPNGAPCTSWLFITKNTQVANLEAIATAFDDKLMTAAKSINGRTSTTILAADKKLIKDALLTIGNVKARSFIVPTPIPPVITPPVITPPSASSKKFNPGFYVRPDALPGIANAGDVKGMFSSVCSEPAIKGFLLSIPWGSIETGRGSYNFAVTDALLTAAKACGKKAIIEPWYQQYGGNGRDTRFFPQYVIDSGGVDALGNGEYHVKINEQVWAERYIALSGALAARYDTNPDIEQFVITESASISTVPSRSAGILKTIIPAVAMQWPHTQVVAYPNWVDSPEMARDLLAIMAPLGVGVGAPDIIGPPGMGDQDMGSRALLGVGRDRYFSKDTDPIGDFGNIDYRNKIIVAYQYQGLRQVAASQVIEYALTKLKATHLVFSMINGYGGQSQWQYTLPIIKANASRINTTRPSSL